MNKARFVPPVEDAVLLCSATELARRIREMEVTSVEVVSAFIRRIKLINPIVCCIVEQRFNSALEEAKGIDTMLASKHHDQEDLKQTKPFLGVPFTVKSNIAVEGLVHMAGIFRRCNLVAAEDATVVEKLRKAGGIVLGTTNMSELGLWWESFNNVHGRTYNAFDVTRTAGGSSGGEAVVLTASASPLGIGSDLGGSIRIPAMFNGIFSHKPTNQTVPLQGHYPCGNHKAIQKYLTIGPMSRFASDLLPALKILIGDEHREALNLDNKVNIAKIKVYYIEEETSSFGVTKVDLEIKLAIQNTVEYLQKVHGLSVRKVHLSHLKYSFFIWLVNLCSLQDKPVITEELTSGVEFNKGLELIKSCVGLSSYTLPALAACMLETAFLKFNGTQWAESILQKSSELLKEMQELLGSDGVLLCPTCSTSAPHHIEPIFRSLDFSYASIFNVLGFPVTQCPLGLNKEGLPIGIQIVASHFQDQMTISIAEELERAFGGWVQPAARM